MTRVRSLAAAAEICCAAALISGCNTFPGAKAAGERLEVDAFVTFTAPLQVPWVAGREAWAACDGEGAFSKLWLPAYFVGFTFAEAGLSALHTLDIVAAPIHVIAGNGPPGIYRGCEFPLQRTAPLASRATGELALYGVAGAGGAAIGYWFATTYVPGIFSFFTGSGSGGILTGG